MSHKNFTGSLAEEQRCTQWLVNRNFFDNLWKLVDESKTITNVEVKEGYFKYFDVELTFSDKTTTTIEIKLDKATQKWGNALIECTARDAPSGISVTTSEYWLHLMFSSMKPGRLVAALTKTDVLKKLVGTNKFQIAQCGDWDKAYGGKVGRGFRVPERVILENICTEKPITFDLESFVKDTGIKAYDPSKYKGSF